MVHRQQDIKWSRRNIEFSIIAKSFLKYYWYQIYRYKIKQNYNLDKLPLIVQIIQNIFGKGYIPEPFESMENKKIEKAEKDLTEDCFPRFQNISTGIQFHARQIVSKMNSYVNPLSQQHGQGAGQGQGFVSGFGSPPLDRNGI